MFISQSVVYQLLQDWISILSVKTNEKEKRSNEQPYLITCFLSLDLKVMFH